MSCLNSLLRRVVVVYLPLADLMKLKGLGFFGIHASGMHHQEHHLMIARGGHPHG